MDAELYSTIAVIEVYAVLWSSSGDLQHTILPSQCSLLVNMSLGQIMFENWAEMTSLSIQLSLLLLL